jgi:hypothetical protein
MVVLLKGGWPGLVSEPLITIVFVVAERRGEAVGADDATRDVLDLLLGELSGEDPGENPFLLLQFHFHDMLLLTDVDGMAPTAGAYGSLFTRRA